jgi:hypothetical protein
MGRGRAQQGTPDLFSTASPGETSSPTATKQVASVGDRPYVLPKDLPNTVKHLNDRELDMLITASLEEASRRGRLPPTVHLSASDESVSKPSLRTHTSSHPRQVEVATILLTRGQINAVRAAFKAGIKPALIARQFGISQSDVRKVLASDASVRRAR